MRIAPRPNPRLTEQTERNRAIVTSDNGAVRRHRGLLSISRSLQVLAIAVLVLSVTVTAVQLLSMRAAIIADTKRQMARLDMVFAEQTGRAVETVDLILRNAIDSLRTLRDNPPVDGAAFDVLLRARIRGVRQVLEVVVTDPQGRILYSSRPGPHPPLPAADRALIGRAGAGPDPGLVFSRPLRIDDGEWTSLMLRRIIDRDGRFAGAAIAYLNLLYFADFYKAVELTENGAILLHLRDGTVLVRYPGNDAAVGQSYADLPPFKDILAHAMAGTVVMDSPLDGRRRVLAIRALKAFPLAVNVSVAENMVLAGWRRQTLTFSLVVAAASLITVGLLLLLAQRSRQVEGLLGEYRLAKEAAEKAHDRLLEQMAERERAEAALRQAQRIEALGQLTGGVAHDFNNLLTVVIGNIDLVQEAAAADPELPERLKAMRAAAERGAMLTGHLLAFARRQPLSPRPVDLNAVILGMQDLLRSALGRGIAMETVLAPSLSPAMVDPTQIELVILNLVINARDAMPDGGVVTIETSDDERLPSAPLGGPADGGYVALRVRDTGTGMTPEVQAQAFEPFFTTKGPGAGSGLGLSQVFGTARQSGGDAIIGSAPGRGSTVSVYLPRAALPAEPVPPAATAAAEPSASAAVILVVDDDAAVRSTVAQILRSLGYAVHPAAGGAEALELLRRGEPVDLLLTDLVMTGLSGLELARAAQALRPRLPVVFISGYADLAETEGEMRLHRLVRKPFRPAELRLQIEAALAASRSVVG
jgi:signal transduction histidine kinase/CheY-like chemotaxis protein